MDAQPFPPSPAATCRTTWSTNDATATSGFSRGWNATRGGPLPARPSERRSDDRISGCRSGRRQHAHGLAAALGAEGHRAVGEGEQRVVAATADAVTGVEVGAVLADDDLAGADD